MVQWGRGKRAKGRGHLLHKPRPSGPAHSPLDVGVILFQEVIVLPPVLKNVFNETAWGPHGDKSVPSCWKLHPPEDLGAPKLVYVSCDQLPQPKPLISLPCRRGASTAG